jgi:hypothetical protein
MKIMSDLRDLARSTTVVTMPGKLPRPITREDCKKRPDLQPVRNMGKLAYAMQLFHLQDVRRSIRAAKITEEQKRELLAETQARFDAIKAEALQQFPE